MHTLTLQHTSSWVWICLIDLNGKQKPKQTTDGKLACKIYLFIFICPFINSQLSLEHFNDWILRVGYPLIYKIEDLLKCFWPLSSSVKPMEKNWNILLWWNWIQYKCNKLHITNYSSVLCYFTIFLSVYSHTLLIKKYNEPFVWYVRVCYNDDVIT